MSLSIFSSTDTSSYLAMEHISTSVEDAMAERYGLAVGQSEPEDESYDENSLFDIGLNPTGDNGSSFRTQNDPAAPYQRRNVTERKGDPEVYRIAPFESMAMVPTTALEEKKRWADFKLGAPPLAGFQAGTELGWERTVISETTDATRIIGTMDLRGRNYGEPNGVSWTLLENEAQRTGVPTVLRTAILLKRRNDAKFRCTVKLDVNVDFRSKLERMIGGKPRDDPVLFDPDMDPTNRLEAYDILNLEAVDLEKISGITLVKYYDRAVKHI